MNAPRDFTIGTRPEPMTFAVEETAVIVVDMQHAYASPGGYLDLCGRSVPDAGAVIAKITQVVASARAAGMKVIYFQNGWDPDYVEAGGPGSPNWHKSNAMREMRRRPELQGQLLAKGGWDHELVEELAPRPEDWIIQKPRYGGFTSTPLNALLRSAGIKNLVFTGIATNVCVESTIREAFHLEYFAVLLEDAAQHSGPDFMQKATVFSVENFFGWVATVDDFSAALAETSVTGQAARHS